MNRRKFLGASALIGISTYFSPRTLLSNPVKKSKLKLGFIGTGLRGQGMMRLATYRNDVDIPVICDIDDGMINKALNVLKQAGRPMPMKIWMVFLLLLHGNGTIRCLLLQ